jgi:hypothetical protein
MKSAGQCSSDDDVLGSLKTGRYQAGQTGVLNGRVMEGEVLIRWCRGTNVVQ